MERNDNKDDPKSEKEWTYRPRKCKIHLTKRRFKAQTEMNNTKAEVKSTLVV